ncbi:pterin-4-alpha-carbinolamine dehydratase [Rickettsia rhipicephali]|uniref:4a-hydroxytetrahydrobiopterin dehydratase n=1 Tax=Rickettsia rhipicephali (strain 3-7-female6-CWPP) TaxID=1105113 RepID=A0AAI8A9H5_RICR3|nr:4a-hydroxytetrahydrobiopterin dehydratase [Rickettsia rhipicephali]AFC72089.1 putative pterin-4-alpha-carbinolamine dehydratase [Rickettsia rhipicephali str. 3-7-female6-CWPP]ALN41579.1 pterin-4-alpha-carbinolamine dehydratase [Rickettsia rhipicephali]
MTVLSEKRCVPCEGGVPPLEKKEIDKLLVQLQSEWKYKFSNFIKAMEFANKITEIAEQEAHHPDLTISWGACSVEIWTHKIDGLTENDFILAAKIESKI